MIFQRLLADRVPGKRLIPSNPFPVCRNTIDCGIQTVRELKQLGIAVEFEKRISTPGRWAAKNAAEYFGISRTGRILSISKNLKWSYRRRMKSGDFITCSAPIGYVLKNKTLVPDPQEIPIVEHIFSSYLAGKSIGEIADELNEAELKSDKKNSEQWHATIIRYILSNEKYIGDSLVQKRYTPDELPLRQRRNKGEVSQYYIKDSHPAIIAKEIYEAVQELLQQRIEQHAPKQKIRKSPLSNTMQCSLCGSAFHKHKSK